MVIALNRGTKHKTNDIADSSVLKSLSPARVACAQNAIKAVDEASRDNAAEPTEMTS